MNKNPLYNKRKYPFAFQQMQSELKEAEKIIEQYKNTPRKIATSITTDYIKGIKIWYE